MKISKYQLFANIWNEVSEKFNGFHSLHIPRENFARDWERNFYLVINEDHHFILGESYFNTTLYSLHGKTLAYKDEPIIDIDYNTMVNDLNELLYELL